MKLPDNIEVKHVNLDGKDDNGDGLPDELKKMLAEALGGAAVAARRAKMLALAVKLPGLNSPEEAIKAAQAFEAYVMGEVK